jgi:hypothetical protein
MKSNWLWSPETENTIISVQLATTANAIAPNTKRKQRPKRANNAKPRKELSMRSGESGESVRRCCADTKSCCAKDTNITRKSLIEKLLLNVLGKRRGGCVYKNQLAPAPPRVSIRAGKAFLQEKFLGVSAFRCCDIGKKRLRKGIRKWVEIGVPRLQMV